MTWSWAEVIEQRVALRTATRGEWHALRRHRSRRARGLPTLDLGLWVPVVTADFARAGRAWLKSPAARAISRLAAASGAQSTITGMEGKSPHDMETIGEDVRGEVALAQPAFGTFLPQLVVDAQVELARLPHAELAKRFADIVVAMTLRHGPSATPKKMLTKFCGTYKISDEAWYERTGPELRRVIRAHGVELHELPE